MKHFNHSMVYDQIQTCGQLHLFTSESINTYETKRTSFFLYSDLVFLITLVQELQFLFQITAFTLRRCLNPGLLQNDPLQLQSDRGLI